MTATKPNSRIPRRRPMFSGHQASTADHHRAPAVLLCLVIGVALLAGACGTASETGVAHLGSNRTSTSPPSAGASPAASSDAELEKFSTCMRGHGVPNFPDPQGGHISFGWEDGINSDSPTFQSALRTCGSFDSPSPALQAERAQLQSRLLKYSACVRAHGEPNFPDPVFTSESVTFNFRGIDTNSPQYRRATRACQSLLPAGTGPPGGTS